MREFALQIGNEILEGECYLHLRRQGISCARQGEYLCVKASPPALAAALADFLLDDWQRQRLWQMIYDIFDCFTLAEQHWLAVEVQHRLAGKTDIDLPFCGEDRREKLTAMLLEYLKANDRLDLCGFLHFRLLSWEQSLLITLAASADKLVLAKDEDIYNDFLRNFVSQRTEGEVINIILSEKVFWLYRGMPPTFAEGGSRADGDELLLAQVLLEAPAAVNLHFLEQGIEAQSITDTLAQAFGSRFVLCRGCPLCGKKSQETLLRV